MLLIRVRIPIAHSTGHSTLCLKAHPLGRVADVLWKWFWKGHVTLMLVAICRQAKASCLVAVEYNDLLGFTNSVIMSI